MHLIRPEVHNTVVALGGMNSSRWSKQLCQPGLFSSAQPAIEKLEPTACSDIVVRLGRGTVSVKKKYAIQCAS